MARTFLVLALALNLPMYAFAAKIDITVNTDSSGKRAVDSKRNTDVPETGWTGTELTFHGNMTTSSSPEICNQFVVPAIDEVAEPASLNSRCKLRAWDMTANDCPGAVTVTILVEGFDCEATVDLMKSSPLHLKGSVSLDRGSDISNVDFFVN